MNKEKFIVEYDLKSVSHSDEFLYALLTPFCKCKLI